MSTAFGRSMSLRFRAPTDFRPVLDHLGNIADDDSIERILANARAYEDYADGYLIGVKYDNHCAEKRIRELALNERDAQDNTPNSALLGYIHGKAERMEGSPCIAAVAYAHKIGRTEHFKGLRPEPLGHGVKTGRMIRNEQHEKWVPLSGFLDAVNIVSEYKPKQVKDLGDAVEVALREYLSK